MNSIAQAELSYEINYIDMTIENTDSNGPKEIYSWYGSSDDEHPHVQYINDDGRIWAQAVTWGDIMMFEVQEMRGWLDSLDDHKPIVEEAAVTAADVGMEG